MKRVSLAAALFLLALSVRLGFLVYQFKFSETSQMATYIPTSDRRDYDSIALSLKEGYGYKTPDMLATYRPPFYPLLLTFLYSFLGQSYRTYLAIFLVQAALSSLGVGLIFLIGRKVFNTLTGLIAAVAASFYLPFIDTIADLELENLLFFMPLLFIYSLSKIETRSKNSAKVFTGLLMGLAMLTKNVFLIVLPILTFLWLKLASRGKQFWQAIFIIYLSAALIFSPWVIRNFLIFDQFILSSQQGMALYTNTHPEFRAYNRNKHRAFLWKLPKLNEAERNNYYTNAALKNLKNNPGLYFNRVLDNWRLLLEIDKFPGSFHLLGLSAIVGLIFTRKKIRAMLLGLFFFLMGAQYSVILGLDRFRMPFDWVLILLAAFGVVELLKAKQPTKIRQYELWLDKLKTPKKLVITAKKAGIITLLTLTGISLATIVPKYFSKKIITYPNYSVDREISYTTVLEYQKNHQGDIGSYIGQEVIWPGEVSYLKLNAWYPPGSAKHPEKNLDPEYKDFYDIYYLPSTHYSAFNLTVNRGITPGYYGDGVVMINYNGSLLNQLKNGDHPAVKGKIIGQNFFGQIYVEANELFFAKPNSI